MHGTAGDQLDWLVGVTGFLTSEYSSAKFGFERGDLLPNEALTVLLPQTPQLAGPVARGNRALVDDPNREQVLQSKTEVERRTLAVFGALSYRPTDRLGMRAELRTTWERLEFDSIIANFAPSFGTTVPAQDFTDTTPRFSIDFAPDANSLLYVSAAKGSRSGGINAIPGLSPQEQTFDPEYNWTYDSRGVTAMPSSGGSAALPCTTSIGMTPRSRDSRSPRASPISSRAIPQESRRTAWR